MKVTLVSLEWPGHDHVGGVGRYAYRLAESLKEVTDLTVITREGAEMLSGVQFLTVPRSQSRMGRYYVEPLRVRGLMNTSRPDVVHSFGDDWAISHRWPLVRTFLGSSLGEARSSTGLRKANHYVLALTEHISRVKADVTIGIGPDSFDEFKCDELMPPLTVVNTADHRTAKTDDPSVIFIGSFHGRKRGHVVDQIVSDVAASIGRPVSLTVVGPETDRHLWGPKVRFLAGASDSEVKDAIRKSWLLMAPSLYEGFGIPVFEAMSLGVPAIATQNPGTAFVDSLRPGTTSLRVARSDSDLRDLAVGLLARGPLVPADERAATRSTVEALLEMADPRRLDQELYPAAQQRFSGNSSLRKRLVGG